MTKYWQAATPLLLLFCLTGCLTDPVTRGITEGYRPVYGLPSMKEVALVDIKQVRNPGKIYIYKDYLLINEINEGIHIFDNANPKSPEPMGFIQIVGNSDMAIRNDILYADHLGNLIAITISDLNNINKVGSLPLQNWDQGVPPPAGAYFECVDPSKGLVIRWNKVELDSPECYAIN